MTGKTYDLRRAAADACEAWAGKLKLEFAFETDGQRFERDQQVKALLELASKHRRKSRPRSGRLSRTDELC